MSESSKPEQSHDSAVDAATKLVGIILIAVVLGAVWLFVVLRLPYQKPEVAELAALSKPRIAVALILQKHLIRNVVEPKDESGGYQGGGQHSADKALAKKNGLRSVDAELELALDDILAQTKSDGRKAESKEEISFMPADCLSKPFRDGEYQYLKMPDGTSKGFLSLQTKRK